MDKLQSRGLSFAILDSPSLLRLATPPATFSPGIMGLDLGRTPFFCGFWGLGGLLSGVSR